MHKFNHGPVHNFTVDYTEFYGSQEIIGSYQVISVDRKNKIITIKSAAVSNPPNKIKRKSAK